jgi:hypothetical protein
MADQENIPTWLTAMPGSHALYLRYNFEDRCFFDVDLNRWDGGRCRGYGVYRSYAMFRPVQCVLCFEESEVCPENHVHIGKDHPLY